VANSRHFRASRAGDVPNPVIDENAGMTESQERWTTKDEVLEACRRYEARISGWQCPRLFGLGLRRHGLDPWFPFVCHGDHPLPAVILATVVGHRGGTCGYDLGLQELDQAITLLAPAEACQYFAHPNLAAWRRVRLEAEGLADPRLVAVFDADPESATDNVYVLALRHAGSQA
jgi:hypothetical protein